MRLWFFLSLAPFVACSGGTDEGTKTPPAESDADADADADTDADTDVDCTATITGVTPGPADTDVPLDAEVRVDFSEAILETDPYSITVSGASGTTTLAADGLSASWIGDALLSADTSYTVDAAVCLDSQQSSFTTAAVVDLNALEGVTFEVPWGDLNFTQPANGGDLIAALGDIDAILLQMSNIDLTTFEVDAAATFSIDDGTGTIVPACGSVVQEVGDFSQNPYFSFGPQTVTFPIGGGIYTDVEALELRAQFDTSGTFATNIQMEGLIAVEELPPFYADCNSPLMALFLPTCLPCTVSTTGSCMLIEADAPMANISTLDIIADCGLDGTTTSTSTGTSTSTSTGTSTGP